MHILLYFWFKIPQELETYNTCLVNDYMSDRIFLICISSYVYVSCATLLNPEQFLIFFWFFWDIYNYNYPYKVDILPKSFNG